MSTWDETFLALYGIHADAPRRVETWLERLHPEDRSRLSARIDRLRTTSGDDRWSEVFRSLSADGRVRWHQGIGQVYRDAEGSLVKMAGIVLDITARKETEDAVREREAQLDLVVRHYPGVVARVARDLRYVYASPRYEEWLGTPSSTVLGRTIADVIGPGPYAKAAPFVMRALAGELVSFENSMDLPTGRRWWAQTTFVPVSNPGGLVPGFFVFATDITDRKLAEMELAKTQAGQTFLLRLGNALRPLTDPLKVQETATRMLGEHLGVNRVHYAEVDGDEFVVRCAYATGVEPLMGRYRVERLGGMPPDQPQQGSTVAVNDVETDPRLSDAERARMRAVHIGAGVRLTLVRGGRAVAGAAVNQIAPRVWTPDELWVIEQVAERIFHEADRLRIEHHVRETARRDAFALQLSDALRVETDPHEIQALAGRALGEFLGASRVVFAEATGQRDADVVAEWALGVASLAGSRLPAVPHGSQSMATPSQEPVIVEDASCDPRLDPAARAAWSTAQIAAAVNVPRSRDGRWVATFAVHSATARPWTPGDIVVIQNTAERTWQAVDRAQAALALQSAQMALQASEVRYRGLAEQIPDGIFVADAQGRFMDANQAACDLVGYTLSELRSVTVQDLLADEELPKLATQFAELRGGGVVRNAWVFKRKDGSTFAGELVGRQFPDGRLQGVLRDLSERSKATEAVRTLEALHRDDSDTLRALLTCSAQGILSVTEDGIIQSVNPALATLLGWAPDELVGRSHDVLILPVQRGRHSQAHTDYWAAPLARPMGAGLELQALKKDGTTLPVEISLAPIHTSRGREAFAFITDISNRRRAEQERAAHLRELQDQSHVLRRLASQLTLAEQDAREHLAKVIHNHLQQVLFSARLRHQRLSRRFAGAAGSEAELMNQIGHDIDEAIVTTRSLVAELFPPMLHDAGLAAALTWLQGWAQQQYGLTVDLEADPAANPAARDVRTLVFESVKELVFNAVKHAKIDRLAIDLALTDHGDVRLVVADGGAGFEPEDLLAPGRTPGTGFGLLAIRERLASLGGRLDVEAAPGRGARFTLTVPRGMTPSPEDTNGDGMAAKNSDPAAGHVPAAGRPLRIVLADDHALVRDGLRQLLADHPGLEVVGEAADGDAAVALVCDVRPDVVIMDVAMPRVNGVEATRRIRTALPHIVVLGLSTEERPAGLHAIEDAGAAGYFAKGDDAHRLLERLLKLHASATEPSAT